MAGWFGLLPRACPELAIGVRAGSVFASPGSEENLVYGAIK